MPRECPLAFRSVPAVAGAGSTKRRSVRPLIAPARCHVRCCALRATAQCGVHADLGGLTQRHNHGRLIRSLNDARASPLSLQAGDGVNQCDGLHQHPSQSRPWHPHESQSHPLDYPSKPNIFGVSPPIRKSRPRQSRGASVALVRRDLCRLQPFQDGIRAQSQFRRDLPDALALVA